MSPAHCLLLPALWLAAPGAAPKKPGPPHVITVETRDLAVEFAGERAWTIYRILYRGTVLGDRTGFYGTVFSPVGGRWIGTGHTEGGVEHVQSVSLTVDGKACPLVDRAHLRGARAEVNKRSMLGPIRLHASYTVTEECIIERHEYEFTEDVAVGVMYAFMHCWPPSTTEWIAETASGETLDGTFDDAGDFEFGDDARWTAIYDPGKRLAALTWHPQPLPGQGHKTAFWDKTVYHKQYSQIFHQSHVAKGTRLDVAVVIRPIEADAGAWKSAARAAAADTAARFSRGEPAFCPAPQAE